MEPQYIKGQNATFSDFHCKYERIIVQEYNNIWVKMYIYKVLHTVITKKRYKMIWGRQNISTTYTWIPDMSK